MICTKVSADVAE